MLGSLNYFYISLLIIFPYTLNGSTAIYIQSPEKYQEYEKFTKISVENFIPNISHVIPLNNTIIKIFLTNNKKSFASHAGYTMPFWVNGFTQFPENKIVLKTPDFSNTNLNQFKKLIIHEVIHSLQSQYIPLSLTPTWFNEGLAVYYSDIYNLNDRIIISKALVRNNIIPIDMISNFLDMNPAEAVLAYAESSSIIEFIIQNNGTESIKNILLNIKEGKTFSEAFEMVTNIELNQLQYYWKIYITKKYSWIFLLDIQYIIWLFFPFLLILAFIRMKFKNKVIIKNWDESIEVE